MDVPQIVLDTNVVAAAARSRRGASNLLLSLVDTGKFDVHLSIPLTLEYEAVLTRQRDVNGLTQQEVGEFVDALCAVAVRHRIHFLWRPFLRDAGDEQLLELAVAARSARIVTYNLRDFTGASRFGVEVSTPKEFLQLIGELP